MRSFSVFMILRNIAISKLKLSCPESEDPNTLILIVNSRNTVGTHFLKTFAFGRQTKRRREKQKNRSPLL